MVTSEPSAAALLSNSSPSFNLYSLNLNPQRHPLAHPSFRPRTVQAIVGGVRSGVDAALLSQWEEMPAACPSESIEVREVWNDNLEDEFQLIRRVVDEYPYVAMDTEFPGIVIRPLVKHKSDDKDKEFLSRSLKANVAASKLIQLGLTFSDADGNLPTFGTDKHFVWQFNFLEFDPATDRFSKVFGIDFEKNGEEGVDSFRFVELLISSGVVMNEEVHQIMFHSACDFGYLVKLITGKNLLEMIRITQ